MTCFTWTLVPIAFVGILLYFCKPRGVTVDDNPLLPLYEVLMAFWAISFLTVSVIPHWGLDIIVTIIMSVSSLCTGSLQVSSSLCIKMHRQVCGRRPKVSVACGDKK